MKAREYPSDWNSAKWEDDVLIDWVVDKNRDPYWWWLEFKAIRTEQSARMHFATIYNPVPEMVAWLDHLSKGHPAGSFRVDEESWCLRFWARPLNCDLEDRTFELRIDHVTWILPDEDEDECEVFSTLLLVKTEKKTFVTRMKKILLDVVRHQQEAIIESPTGDIDADWEYDLHGKRWTDIITRLDEIETEETEVNS